MCAVSCEIRFYTHRGKVCVVGRSKNITGSTKMPQTQIKDHPCVTTLDDLLYNKQRLKIIKASLTDLEMLLHSSNAFIRLFYS